MVYSQEVQHMCVVKKGPNHGPAPIPEEGKWVKANQRHLRFNPRDRLVCSSAGDL